ATMMPSSPGAEEAGPGSARGAAAGGAIGAILGLGAVPVAGALGVLSGVGVGAYAGSLLGALRGIGNQTPASGHDARARRGNGGGPEGEEGAGPRFVVLKTLRPEGRDCALHILNEHGAVRVSEVERDADD